MPYNGLYRRFFIQQLLPIIEYIKDNLFVIAIIGTILPIIGGGIFYVFSFAKRTRYVCNQCGTEIITESSKVTFCSVCGAKNSYEKR